MYEGVYPKIRNAYVTIENKIVRKYPDTNSNHSKKLI
jgi:hypothetical protein